jgi:hypothetical protein
LERLSKVACFIDVDACVAEEDVGHDGVTDSA